MKSIALLVTCLSLASCVTPRPALVLEGVAPSVLIASTADQSIVTVRGWLSDGTIWDNPQSKERGEFARSCVTLIGQAADLDARHNGSYVFVRGTYLSNPAEQYTILDGDCLPALVVAPKP
jgi:hypothetical protein